MSALFRSSAFWWIGFACAASMLGCDALLGYDELEPWPEEAGVGGSEELDAASDAGADEPDGEADEPDGKSDEPEPDAQQVGEQPEPDGAAEAGAGDAAADAAPDGAVDAEVDAAPQPDAGQCATPSGQDLCESLPRFSGTSQVVDGLGSEFCGIRAMTLTAVSCASVKPDPPPALPASATLRVAWSTEALHLHVRVMDPTVIVQADRAQLWNGDAVEIYIAGASGAQLTGAFDGSNDGGAIQLILTPPSGPFPARGEAFFSRFGAHAEIDASLYAGRLIQGGYELELRYPWPATANPAVARARVAFDFGLNVQDAASAGGRQLQCIISDVFVDGSQACGLAAGTPAEPYCDDRTWCQPELSP